MAVFCFFLFVNIYTVYAEGAYEYTYESAKKTPNIPFNTSGTIHVYAREGESIYFGIGTADNLVMTKPNGENITVRTAAIGASFEKLGAGPNGLIQPGSDEVTTNGYNVSSTAGTYIVNQSGIYSFKLPVKTYWDITVADNKTKKVTKGRVYCDEINTEYAGQSSKVYSKVFVPTKDGYIWEYNYNGYVPVNAAVFVNSRGLVNKATNSSLYHSIRCIGANSDRKPVLPALKDINGNDDTVVYAGNDNEPTELDYVNHMFFNPPATDLPKSIVPDREPVGKITDTSFVGTAFEKTDGTPEETYKTYAGQGGYFIFDNKKESNVSSYSVIIDMSNMYYIPPTEPKANYQGPNDQDIPYSVELENGTMEYNFIYKKGSGEYYAIKAKNNEKFSTSDYNNVEYVPITDSAAIKNIEEEITKSEKGETSTYISCGRVLLGNAAVEGKNQAYWNGRDENGRVLPAGVYFSEGRGTVTFLPKGGETHFPVGDAEQVENGFAVWLENPPDSYLEGKSVQDQTILRSMLYYNNENKSILRSNNKANWHLNYEGAQGTGLAEPSSRAIDGINSYEYDEESKDKKTTNKACVFPTYYQGGNYADRSWLDVWTYVPGEQVPLSEPIVIEPNKDNIQFVKGFVFYDEADVGKDDAGTGKDGVYDTLNRDYGLAGATVVVEYLDEEGKVDSTKGRIITKTNEEGYYHFKIDTTKLNTNRQIKLSVFYINNGTMYICTPKNLRDAAPPSVLTVGKLWATNKGTQVEQIYALVADTDTHKLNRPLDVALTLDDTTRSIRIEKVWTPETLKDDSLKAYFRIVGKSANGDILYEDYISTDNEMGSVISVDNLPLSMPRTHVDPDHPWLQTVDEIVNVSYTVEEIKKEQFDSKDTIAEPSSEGTADDMGYTDAAEPEPGSDGSIDFGGYISTREENGTEKTIGTKKYLYWKFTNTIKPASITENIWYDSNNNGIKDELTGKDIAGAAVKIYKLKSGTQGDYTEFKNGNVHYVTESTTEPPSQPEGETVSEVPPEPETDEFGNSVTDTVGGPDRTYYTDAAGNVTWNDLPSGSYKIEIQRPGTFNFSTDKNSQEEFQTTTEAPVEGTTEAPAAAAEDAPPDENGVYVLTHYIDLGIGEDKTDSAGYSRYGSLTISKNIAEPERESAKTSPYVKEFFENATFSFTAHIDGMEGAVDAVKTVKVASEPSAEETSTESVTLNFTGGTASEPVILKNGESLSIPEVPAGAGYTIEEAALTGFETKEPQTGNVPVWTEDETARNLDVPFENIYSPEGVTIDFGDLDLTAEKVIEGRTFAEGETFDFTAEPVSEETTSPALANPGCTLAIGPEAAGKDRAEISLKGIVTEEITEPGVYSYRLSEVPGSDPFMTYDSASYIIEFEVEDGTDGRLRLKEGSANIKTDPGGTPLDRAEFTNTEFGKLKITKSISEEKTDLTDEDAERDFTFTVTFAKEGLDPEHEYSYTLSTDTGDTQGTIQSGGTITLRHNQSVTIDGITAGTQYTIKETPVPDFRQDQEEYTGTVNPEEMSVTVVNIKTGSLTFEPQMEGVSSETYTGDTGETQKAPVHESVQKQNGTNWVLDGWTKNKEESGEVTVKPSGVTEPGGDTEIPFGDGIYYGIWAEDSNNNSVPDYEDARVEYYKNDSSDNTVPFFTEAVDRQSEPQHTLRTDTELGLTNDGYVFLGWTETDPKGKSIQSDGTNADEILKYSTVTSVPTADATYENPKKVYALWAEDRYDYNNPPVNNDDSVTTGSDGIPDYMQVIYYGNRPESETVNKPENIPKYGARYSPGEHITILPEDKNLSPRLKGHVFGGWSLKSEPGEADTLYQPGEKDTLTKEAGLTRLYAVWTDPTHKIFYHANGGTGTDDPYEDRHNLNDNEWAPVLPNEGAEHPNFEKTDSVVIGWTLGSAADKEGNITSSGEITVVNGEEQVGGKRFYRPTDLNNPEDKGIHVTDFGDNNDNIDLFAVWADDKAGTPDENGNQTGDGIADFLQVVYYGNKPDGAEGNVTNIPVDEKQYTAGGSVTVLPENGDSPGLEGYKFTGWASSSDGPAEYQPGQKDLVKSDTVTEFYAVWKPVYKVIYHANGGSVVSEGKEDPYTDPAEYAQGDPVTVIDNETVTKYKRTGAVFLGWTKDEKTETVISTQSEFDESKLYKSGTINAATTVDSADINFYAVWAKDEVGTYENGVQTGDGTPDYEEAVYLDESGQAQNMPQKDTNLKAGEQYTVSDREPTRDGYEFKGWSGSDGNTYQASDTVEQFPEEGLILEAMWEQVTTTTETETSTESTTESTESTTTSSETTTEEDNPGDDSEKTTESSTETSSESTESTSETSSEESTESTSETSTETSTSANVTVSTESTTDESDSSTETTTEETSESTTESVEGPTLSTSESSTETTTNANVTTTSEESTSETSTESSAESSSEVSTEGSTDTTNANVTESETSTKDPNEHSGETTTSGQGQGGEQPGETTTTDSSGGDHTGETTTTGPNTENPGETTTEGSGGHHSGETTTTGPNTENPGETTTESSGGGHTGETTTTGPNTENPGETTTEGSGGDHTGETTTTGPNTENPGETTTESPGDNTGETTTTGPNAENPGETTTEGTGDHTGETTTSSEHSGETTTAGPNAEQPGETTTADPNGEHSGETTTASEHSGETTTSSEHSGESTTAGPSGEHPGETTTSSEHSGETTTEDHGGHGDSETTTSEHSGESTTAGPSGEHPGEETTGDSEGTTYADVTESQSEESTEATTDANMTETSTEESYEETTEDNNGSSPEQPGEGETGNEPTTEGSGGEPGGNDFRLHYDGNGATGGSVPNDDHLYPDGTNAELMPPGDLSRPGATFVGWSLTPVPEPLKSAEEAENAGIIDDGYVHMDGDVTLYAVWAVDETGGTDEGEQPPGDVPPGGTPNPPNIHPDGIPDYKQVVYDLNYSTDSIPPHDGHEYSKGDTATVVDDTPSRDGYTFAGWATDPEASKPDYKPGDKFTLPDGGEVLYAVWEPVTEPEPNPSHGGNSNRPDQTQDVPGKPDDDKDADNSKEPGPGNEPDDRDDNPGTDDTFNPGDTPSQEENSIPDITDEENPDITDSENGSGSSDETQPDYSGEATSQEASDGNVITSGKISSSDAESVNGTSASGKSIPKTGETRYPFIILIGTGLFLTIVEFINRRKSKR